MAKLKKPGTPGLLRVWYDKDVLENAIPTPTHQTAFSAFHMCRTGWTSIHHHPCLQLSRERGEPMQIGAEDLHYLQTRLLPVCFFALLGLTWPGKMLLATSCLSLITQIFSSCLCVLHNFLLS